MDSALVKQQAQAARPLPPQGVNKWEALRELSAARATFGLSDRDLAVLQALVSFHPPTLLGGNAQALVVHPSNRALCERLNGMPCSTMRRHLARLVATGMVLRRDSPNGKRYARRYGDEKVAFGFDLSPLAARFAEFCTAAEDLRAAEQRLRRQRETVSLMRRDLAGLADYGASVRPDLDLWEGFADLAALAARVLRRKASAEDLADLEARLTAALDAARDCLEMGKTQEMSTSDAGDEQHYQNSKKDLHEYEPRFEKAKGGEGQRGDRPDGKSEGGAGPVAPDRHLPNVPIGLVLTACAEIQTYADGRIRHWHELVQAADIVRPMMGISPSAWDEAREVMGPEEAAVVIAAMLERYPQIASPGGYLRHLTAKAAQGTFSCGPMVMAQLRRAAA